MGSTKKMILLFLLAFYFSCGCNLAKILPSDNKAVVVAEQLNKHNVHGETIAINSKIGHTEAHFGSGKGGNGGEESRSPTNQGGSNVIPIYAANAHHNRHRGAATSHRSHKLYLAVFATMFMACLIA